MARRAKIAKELVEIPSPVTTSGGKSAQVLVFCNNKGGVGKTTTVMNLAGALALKEKRVLAIDLDPQCNASIAFNVIIDKHSGTGVRPLLTKDETNIRECLYPRGPWCDFIPADPDLYEIHTDLAIDPRGRFRLRDHLKTMLPLYDYILIDTPPDVSSYTQSALVAGEAAIIPVDVSVLAVAGLARIVRIINDIKTHYNPDLEILGVLATKYDVRTTLAEDMIAEIKAHNIPLLKTKIRICVDIIRAQGARKPVGLYAPSSHGAIDYNMLADELLPAKVIPIQRRKRATG